MTEEDLENTSITLRDVQAVLLNMFSADTILIGHSLESDLFALKVICVPCVSSLSGSFPPWCVLRLGTVCFRLCSPLPSTPNVNPQGLFGVAEEACSRRSGGFGLCSQARTSPAVLYHTASVMEKPRLPTPAGALEEGAFSACTALCLSVAPFIQPLGEFIVIIEKLFTVLSARDDSVGLLKARFSLSVADAAKRTNPRAI